MAKVKAKAGNAKKGAKPATKAAKPAAKAAKPAVKLTAAPKKSAASAAKRAPKPLSQDERQRLVKPADGYTELAERFAVTWTANKALKVPGMSPSKIKSALARAEKAAAREDALKRKLEEKLRPLQDARLQAEHDVWKLVLDAYAVAKAQARVAPELGRAFAFLGDALSKRSRSKESGAATPAVPAPAPAPAEG